MFYRGATAVLALAGLIAASAPSFAMTGIGCPDLPEHDRAVGTVINGGSACGLTMEEARRILARDAGLAAPGQPAAPTAPAPRKHHRRTTPHM